MNRHDDQIIIFTTADGNISVAVRFGEETVWLTQKQIAEVYETTRPNITMHIQNILKDGELDESSVCKDFLLTAADGKNYNTVHYNLDMIISVGYRVNSKKATQFRQWATKALREYIQKGFLLDDERLKQGQNLFGKDYFRELLERIRSIRASERRIWQQITDIFAECSIDYDINSQITRDFFATIQNKFHYAIAGQTAAEIVYAGADRNKENMGLETWKNAPDGRILKSDVTVAKNYLPEKEIRRLERAITGYFDYVEDLIENENFFTMNEFAASVNEFLTFRKFKVLTNKGKISKEDAEAKAEDEYKVFNKTQRIVSDFDKSLKLLVSKTKSEDTNGGDADDQA